MVLRTNVTTGVGDAVVTRLVQEDRVPWYKKPNLRRLYICIFFCCLGVEMTSGFDSQLINTLQFSTTFNTYFGQGYLNSTGDPSIKPSILGLLSSCYQLGSIAGVPFAPWLNQKFGRRWCVFGGSLIIFSGAFIQGFAQDIGMYIFARMWMGFGIVFCIISGSSLAGELSHPKERSRVTSLFNSTYFIGSIAAAAVSLGTVTIAGDWQWRVPSLLQLFPSALQLLFIWTIPESPRWLVSKGRKAEAEAVLIKYHAEGDETSLLVKAEIAQIESTIELEMSMVRSSWMDIFRSPGMRKRVLITTFIGLFGQLSGNTLLSYYSNLLFELMGFTTSYAKTRINLANQCWSLVTSGGAAIIAPRFKRRTMFILSASCMLAVFVAMTISFEQLRVADDKGYLNHAASISALVWFFAYTPCYNLGDNALVYTYLIEIWPYAERTRGIGVQQIFNKGGAFFSNYVNPIALDAIDWKYLAIYCGWIAFEVIFVIFMYPETSNRTLEELSFLFEDRALADRVADVVEKEIHEGDSVENGAEYEKTGVTQFEKAL